jgi:hypothetical protein
VAIVNARFAARYFGTDSPIDREIAFGNGRRHRVVGVVGDSRYRRLEQAPDPAFYVPAAQSGEFWPFLSLVVDAAGDPAALAPTLRAVVRDADPRQPVATLRPLAQIVDDALAARRLNTALVFAGSAIALLMAVVGAYGVMTSLSAARAREFSIRAALGAPGSQLGGGLLREAALLAVVAVVAGQTAAVLAGTSWNALLFGVGASDPRLLAAAGATLIAATLVACGPAAIRVARSNPIDALRADD